MLIYLFCWGFFPFKQVLIKTTVMSMDLGNVGLLGMNKTWLFNKKKKAVQGDQELGGKAMFSNRNLLCGHCGDDVLIEPQTVWFFRPEVSFKQARKRVMYLSGAPLAPSP